MATSAITRAQMAAFEASARTSFCQRLRSAMVNQPPPVGLRAAERPLEWYEDFLHQALDWGIEIEGDVAGLTHVVLRAGERWLKEPLVLEVLTSDRDGSTKTFQVRHLLWNVDYAG